ncbi:MAG: Eco57I restriction-modification methylase domain-containing protein [Deltaproteobacteria bacterium]|nr:Eco57I restriction-modification methylase domain-containing protein [Deltaproteobacteria bacterium]
MVMIAQKLERHSTVPLLERVDFYRMEASGKLHPTRRSEMGQFLTSSDVAAFMASLFERFDGNVRVLDAGAGVGSLLAAFAAEGCSRPAPPRSMEAVCYEVDPLLAGYLRETLGLCRESCGRAGVRFDGDILDADFIASAVESLDGGLFGPKASRPYTHAILNPPYRKLNSDSPTRQALRRAGIETSNLYAAFLGLAVLLLQPGGELVAITPRSFCNGPYFRAFRELLLREMTLRRLHVFESRTAAFSDDEVLQENVIVHAVKAGAPGLVVVSSCVSPADDLVSVRAAPVQEIVRPGDPQRIIYLVPDRAGQQVADLFAKLPKRLGELGVSVSTGKVVDFRVKPFLRAEPGPNTQPLIYPGHFSAGAIRWPKPGKKPNALVDAPATADLWMPSGTYVLVKRFSSKEEPRRVVAAICDSRSVPAERIGFENHLNVFHANGGGLGADLALGLAVFLSSTLVDTYFRQFNGHTQVNATDLRNLRYPLAPVLRKLGAGVGDLSLAQDQIDRLVEEVLDLDKDKNPLQAKRKADKALSVLKALGLPRQQQNERSALTLLALLGLDPASPWSKAAAPLMGITPIMEFIATHYGKSYAPNTRETVRRQTVHQFVDAGLAVPNPDAPSRPVNSPKAVYQIEAKALELLRAYGTPRWEARLERYLSEAGSLASRYAHARAMVRVAVRLPAGQTLRLSAGRHSELVKLIVEEFCSRFAPGGNVIYVGDTGEKFAVFDAVALGSLGLSIDSHGKMPDVVVHRTDRNWLLLVEAVTSHGPVDPKRRGELARLFQDARAGLVYVTAFMTRKAMVKYIADISWETEVWVAEAPDHMIHFDGERFLGPR